MAIVAWHGTLQPTDRLLCMVCGMRIGYAQASVGAKLPGRKLGFVCARHLTRSGERQFLRALVEQGIRQRNGQEVAK